MKKLYDTLRKMSVNGRLTQKQVDGTEAILKHAVLLQKAQLSYVLATAWHETGQAMWPVIETTTAEDKTAVTVDEAIRRLDWSFKNGGLSWVRTPYWNKQPNGHSYLGRGFVQLTHKDNYDRMGRRLGIDLVNNPDLALDVNVSAQILVTGMEQGLFTGMMLSDYIHGGHVNFVKARRIINGTDRAEDIAGYARQILIGLS